MKINRLMVLPLLILMMVFLSPVNNALATESSALEVAQQWMHNGTKFKSFVNTNSSGENSYTNSFKYWIQNGNNYVSIVSSSVPDYDHYPTQIESSGVGTGYFSIYKIIQDSSNRYIARLYAYIWTGTEWLRLPNDWIMYVNDTTVFGEETVPDFPDPINPGEILYDGNLVITSPPYDGYEVTSDRIEIRYGYGVPCSVPKPGKADITGVGVSPLSHTGTSSRYDSETNMQYNYFKAVVQLEPGYNTITIELNHDGEVYVDSRTVQRLIGVIDEDGDGIDDRTGLPVEGDESELSIEGAPILPDNATILDYVKYAVDSIIYVFSQIGLALKGLIGGIGDIGKILTGFFSFMPQPFTGIIILGLLIAIILRIFGR